MKNFSIFKGLANSFTAIYYVDLDTGDYHNYVAVSRISDLTSQFGNYPKFRNLVEFYISSGIVHPDHRAMIDALYPGDAEVKAMMRNRKRQSCLFQRKYPEGYRWTRLEMIKCEAEDEEAHTIVLTFSECEEDVRVEQALKETLEILDKTQSSDATIADLLALIGDFYSAERAYICEFDFDRSIVCNTCEWCKTGIEPMIDRLQAVPIEQVADWIGEFERNGAFYMETLDSECNTEDTRKTLKMQGVTCLVAAPIRKGGEITGFVGVDNPMNAKRDFRPLRVVATIAYSELLQKKENDERHVTFRKLTDAFLSVYYVDFSRDYIHNYKLASDYKNTKYSNVSVYSEAMIGYMRESIVEHDRARCVQAVQPENVIKAFESCDRFSIETVDILLGYERNIVFDFIKIDQSAEKCVICCREITDIVRERENQKHRLKVEAEKNRTLSEITQKLYGFNLTVDLERGSFTLITGTGAEEALKVIVDSKNYRELFNRMIARIRPEYHHALRTLLALDYLRAAAESGETAVESATSAIYQLTGDAETAKWGEVNVTFGTDADGRKVANILARDITESRRETARHEREMRAASAKDQILSGITQTLYGFDIIVNLAKNTFTVIKGSGCEQICAICDSFNGLPYTEVADYIIKGVPDDYRLDALRVFSRDFLLSHRNRSGYLGTRVLPWCDTDRKEHWIEVNGFMAENGSGDSIANLLGRDITVQHHEQVRREREREAANAKDRILSEITKKIYGYNLTVNLRTMKYSVIVGSGMDAACEIFSSSDDYAQAIRLKREFVVPADRDRIGALMEPESLKKMVADGVEGSIGTAIYEADVNGARQWHETNVFIGKDANGDPIANILGRDITDHYKR